MVALRTTLRVDEQGSGRFVAVARHTHGPRTFRRSLPLSNQSAFDSTLDVAGAAPPLWLASFCCAGEYQVRGLVLHCLTDPLDTVYDHSPTRTHPLMDEGAWAGNVSLFDV